MIETKCDAVRGVHPHIPLTVRRVESNVWWDLGFYKHHYLTADVNKSFMPLLFEWNDMPVAMVVVGRNVGRSQHGNLTISRIVIHPDYQGLGLSRKLMDFVGGVVQSLRTDENNYHITIKTSHEKMGKMLENNPLWKPCASDKKIRSSKTNSDATCKERRMYKRDLTACYVKKYCGPAIYGYEQLLERVKTLRERQQLH